MEEPRQDKLSCEGTKQAEGRKWYSLIDKIWAMPNLEESFAEVKRNRGAAGIDRKTVKAYGEELEHHPRSASAKAAEEDLPAEASPAGIYTQSGRNAKAARYSNSGRPCGTSSSKTRAGADLRS